MQSINTNETKLLFKKLTRHDFYNILQDMRHYLIIDFRAKAKFNESFIRNSFNLETESNEDLDKDLKQLAEIIGKLDNSATMNEKKYKMAKIRRAIFVEEGEMNEESAKYKTFFAFFKENIKFDKYFILTKGFIDFKQKYPFLCLTNIKNEESKEAFVNLKEHQELYSLSRFPCEIMEDLLFLGDVYNSNNEKQLKDLKIKSLVDFIEYKGDSKLPEFKRNNFIYLNIPIDPNLEVGIDFDEINKQIDKLVEDKNYPVLVYCKDGDKISPGFAIAYLMFKKNIKLTIASLSVFQKRSCVEIEKWLYTQLLNYTPNVKK